MRRKLIKQGTGSGLAVYLPKEWISKMHLNPKDEVIIEEEDFKLSIFPDQVGEEKLKSIKISVGNCSRKVLRNYLYSLYCQGFDTIMVKYSQEDHFEYIEHLVRETMLGFEIIEDKKNYCVVQNITEPSKEKFKVILRKIFVIIKNDMKDSFEKIINLSFSDLSRQELHRKMIDEYTNFCRRLVIKHTLYGQSNSYNIHIIISRLSQIAHSYYYLLQKLSQFKRLKLSPSMEEYLHLTTQHFEDFYTVFYSKDREKINALLDSTDYVLKERLLQNISKLEKQELTILTTVTEIIRLIQNNLASLYGIVLEEDSG